MANNFYEEAIESINKIIETIRNNPNLSEEKKEQEIMEYEVRKQKLIQILGKQEKDNDTSKGRR